MGYIRHDTIVITAFDDKDAAYVAERAKALGLLVSPVIPGTTNGYASLFIAPDGSKEGWDESDKHESARQEFINWARDNKRLSPEIIEDKYQKGHKRPCWFDWVYVAFGGDDDEPVIRDHSDK